MLSPKYSQNFCFELQVGLSTNQPSFKFNPNRSAPSLSCKSNKHMGSALFSVTQVQCSGMSKKNMNSFKSDLLLISKSFVLIWFISSNTKREGRGVTCTCRLRKMSQKLATLQHFRQSVAKERWPSLKTKLPDINDSAPLDFPPIEAIQPKCIHRWYNYATCRGFVVVALSFSLSFCVCVDIGMPVHNFKIPILKPTVGYSR